MILIYIEIKKQNRFKDLLHKIFNRLEDSLFNLFQKMPEKMIPTCLMTWMEHYTDKRIVQLQHQIICSKWQTMELEKAVNNIHSRQQI